ncbi:GerMN domain-containing protein [Acetivibrio mesophilus]|uniref:Sporulation protein n=1 Tax=Acetivibrio mesophilus TaxID=2487273 RepID=A0A4Q0I2Q2_9FIRM|nr:GerMN domain-containing protein [Acetivibrio mesophilus]ODM27066.1 sporulation protein [Clostridium sp. Bc-iso-3]RXE58488.1 sporulation protein [Acetivibrio mesophilus]HHV28768.1 sporulation protein [Clostridium sp.]
MKCNFSFEDIIKYSENQLSDEEKKRVKEHLDACERCKRHYGVLKFTETYAKDSSLASKSISKNVMEAIDVNRYSKNKKFWVGRAFHKAMPVIKPILVSAAVLVVVMVGVTNFSNLRGLINNGNNVEPNPTASVTNHQNTNPAVLPESTNPAVQNPVEKRTITLYYSNSNADKVVAEKREVEIIKDTQIERLVFEELQKGPKSEGLYATVPKGTRLLSVSTEGGICTLDLSREFVDNNSVGTAGELMTLYSIINTMTELPNIEKVQFLIEGQKQDAYIHAVLSEPFKRNDKIIQKSSSEIKAEVEAKSQTAIKAIKEKDMEKLASLVHPMKGVLFSPYSHIELEKHKVFTKDQIIGLLESGEVYTWGEYDGSGHPIELTFAQYYDRFIYDHDFENVEIVSYNEIKPYGNTIVNILDIYPDGKFIEYYFPGTAQPEPYDSADWASLRLVFEEYDGQWYLVCIAHGQWTI